MERWLSKRKPKYRKRRKISIGDPYNVMYHEGLSKKPMMYHVKSMYTPKRLQLPSRTNRYDHGLMDTNQGVMIDWDYPGLFGFSRRKVRSRKRNTTRKRRSRKRSTTRKRRSRKRSTTRKRRSRKRSTRMKATAKTSKCKQYLNSKMKENMHKWKHGIKMKNGRYINSQRQAMAISYSQVKKKYPACKRFF